LSLAVRAALLPTTIHCNVRGFLFASLVSGNAKTSGWTIVYCNCSPPSFPLLRRQLGCLLLPIARDRGANDGSRSAVVVVDGARWAKPTLGMGGTGIQQPKAHDQQPVQEMC